MPSPPMRARGAALRKALFGVWALLIAAPAAAATDADPLVELGRRIYMEGRLPDGSPLTGVQIAGGATTTGIDAACKNCHRPSGYGATEGRILVPPIAGAVLFAPGAFAAGARGAAHRRTESVERFRARSAYDDEHFARAVRGGVDVDGLPLDALMPRYRLSQREVSALGAFLRHLSEQPAGIGGRVLHLGTVVTPDVTPARREAILSVLQAFAAEQGKWGLAWQLHVWQLSGPPDTWESQLASYYREQPVFALLSGAGGADWAPVQRFCEQRTLACVLPSVEAAPAIGDSYYSVYFSPGVGLEARLLAHHLAVEPDAPRRLVQVVDGEAGRRAANTVKERLAGSVCASEEWSLEKFAANAHLLTPRDAVVFWLHTAELKTLTASAPPPGEVFLSALLAPPEEVSLPSAWKNNLRYLSIFDPAAPMRTRLILRPWLAREGLPSEELRARADAYAACNFFNEALTAVQRKTTGGIPGPLTRERVLDTLEDVMTVYRDDRAPFYWNMSLGPGQRMPVRAGTLLRYSGDDLVVAEKRFVP